jgi:hypothetical protein
LISMNLRPGTDAAPWLLYCIMPCFQDINALFLGFQGIMPWSALQFHFLKSVTSTCRSPNGVRTFWIKSVHLAPFVHLSAKKLSTFKLHGIWRNLTSCRSHHHVCSKLV